MTSTNSLPGGRIGLTDTATNPLLLLSYGGYVSLQAARTINIQRGSLVSRWLPELGRGGAISLYAGTGPNPFNELAPSYFSSPAYEEFVTNNQNGGSFSGGLSTRNDFNNGPAVSGQLWSRNCVNCTFAGNVVNSTLYSYGGLLALNDQTGTTVVANGVQFRPLVLQNALTIFDPPLPPGTPGCVGCGPSVPPSLPVPPTILSESSGLVQVAVSEQSLTNPLTPTDKISETLVSPTQYKPPCLLLNISAGNKGKSNDKKERPTWLVASGSCQFCAVDLDDPAIVMTGGTRIAHTGDREFDLAGGKIAILTTKHSVDVNTRFGLVSVPANSAAIISQNEKGVVHVANINGEGAADANFRPVGATSSVPVKAGEEVFLADDSVNDEELIPTDGITRDLVVAGTIKVALDAEKPSNVTSKTFKFSRKSMMDKEPTLTCTGGCLSLPLKRKMIQLKNATASVPGTGRTIADAGAPKSEDTTGSQSSPSIYKPVAHAITNPIGTKHLPMLAHIQTESAEILQVGREQLNMAGPNIVRMDNGEMLVNAKQDLEVDCGNVKVSILKGTMAHVGKVNGVVRVRNLVDGHANSVRVFMGKEWIHLDPGQEFILGKSHKEVTFGFTADTIPRRMIREKELSQGVVCGTAEFSPLSLMLEDPILSAVSVSNRDSDKELLNQLLKMAACLTFTTGRHGPYSRPF